MSELSISALSEADNGQRLVDVIFVHGLGGDAITTWHTEDRPENFWPKWLAEDHPEAAVWTIGYPAKVTKWSGKGSGMALPDRGKQVLDYLISSGFGHRPLLFIAHSLGGLLVKQILRASAGLRVQRYEPIGEMTRGVIFLATPHSGSDLSVFAQGLRIFRPTEEVIDLEANNPYLTDLGDWYRNNAPHLDISTYTYRENRRLAGKIWVVEPGSADPGIRGALCIPQDEDHFTIAKPTDKQHPVYTGVRNILGTLSQMEHERNKLTIELEGVMLSVPQPPVAPAAPILGTKKDANVFRDLELGFQFRLPQAKGWSEPERMTLWDYLTRKGIDDEIIEKTKLRLQLVPMGKMLADSSVLCVFYGEPIICKLNEDTTTKALDVYLERLKGVSESEGEPLDDEDIQEIRSKTIRQHLPITSFTVQNGFAIATMQKELASRSPVSPNLPNLFMMTGSVGGPVDSLVASDRSILWGSTVTLKNVEFAGEIRELTANTMNFLTESEDFFYQVSIYYSPQTENPIVVWSQLQEMTESFLILGNGEEDAVS